MDMEWSGIFPILGSMTLFGAIGFGFFWLHRRKVQAENEYLRMQQRLLESYYYEISSQIQKVRHYQKVMDAQMEQILSLDEEQLTDGRLADYLGELRAQYQEVTSGIYCNHWALDALLTQTEKRCRQEGIRTDFLFQEYDGGDLDTGEILFLLQKLLELALQNAKAVPKAQTPAIRLHAATVRNQLVFSLAFSAPSQARISPRPFRRWMRSNRGNLQITRTKDGYTILLTLQKE